MSLKLSIIIPCYNCEKTLKEAVDSCYVQDLTTDQFEIVMVDDGSSDGTREVMNSIATRRPNISVIFHEINRGGGAARNTGIMASAGEIIYCLDSDNVFAPQSVLTMITFLELHKLDGAAFSERRFFHDNTRNYKSRTASKTSEITLIDLFTEEEPLLDNFFFTRKAYDTTDGYPEHHGFDTQGFEFRFLVAGNTIKVCPRTIFYHRQGLLEPSYFERVYKSGLYSINYSLIYEDFLHLLNEAVVKDIVSYPIFSRPSVIGDSLHDTVKQKVARGESIFVDNYATQLQPHSRSIWLANEKNKENSLFSLVQTVHELFHPDNRQAGPANLALLSQSYGVSEYILLLQTRVLLRHTLKKDNIKAAVDLLAKMNTAPIIDSPFKAFVKRNFFIYRIVQKIKHL